eukprot:15432768-Alexandrium_andersonii.AAC.1
MIGTPGHTGGLSRACPGHVPCHVPGCPGSAEGLSRACPGHVPGVPLGTKPNDKHTPHQQQSIY